MDDPGVIVISEYERVDDTMEMSESEDDDVEDMVEMSEYQDDAYDNEMEEIKVEWISQSDSHPLHRYFNRQLNTRNGDSKRLDIVSGGT